MAGLDQAAGHMEAHVAEADKADIHVVSPIVVLARNPDRPNTSLCEVDTLEAGSVSSLSHRERVG